MTRQRAMPANLHPELEAFPNGYRSWAVESYTAAHRGELAFHFVSLNTAEDEAVSCTCDGNSKWEKTCWAMKRVNWELAPKREARLLRQAAFQQREQAPLGQRNAGFSLLR